MNRMVKIGSAISGVIAASFVLLPLRVGPDAPELLSPASETAPSPPPPPPCIREHCFERPKRLRCTVIGGVPGRCDTYEIDYDVKCDCMEWGVRSADAGSQP